MSARGGSLGNIRSPEGHPNGRTPIAQTPFQPPLPAPPFQSAFPTLPSPSTPPESGGDDFTPASQIVKVSEQIKPQSIKIALCVPTGGEKTLAESVANCLRQLVSGGNVQVIVVEMKRDGQHWLQSTRELSVKYYVFFGLPPARSRPFMMRQNSSAQEDEFFNPLGDDGHRVSKIIFIDPQVSTPSQRSCIPKNLKSFLHLDGTLGADELAKRILGHFAGE